MQDGNAYKYFVIVSLCFANLETSFFNESRNFEIVCKQT